jgi:hypothetical protein
MRALAITLLACLGAVPAHADSAVWCKTYDQDLWRQPYTKLPSKKDTIRIAAGEVDPCVVAPILEKLNLRDAAAAEHKYCAIRSAADFRLAAPDSPLLKLTP